MVEGMHGHAGLDQRGCDVRLQVGKSEHKVWLQRENLFDIRRGEGRNPRLLPPHLRWPHGIAGDADDPLVLAEHIKRLDGFLGEADDPARRKFLHGRILRQNETDVRRLRGALRQDLILALRFGRARVAPPAAHVPENGNEVSERGHAPINKEQCRLAFEAGVGRDFMFGRFAVALALLGFALAGAVEPALAQKAGGTLRIYHRNNPPSTSILEEATVDVTVAYMGVFNNLVMVDPAKQHEGIDTIVPDLATSWSWDDSKTKLTFKLREGVKWHDGQPFTAKDVKCTWDMLAGKAEGTDFRRNPRKVWYFNLDQVTTNGDYEATFVLKQPQPAFLLLLTSGYSPVYSCHVPPAQMRTKPIGTGPFKFVEYKRGDSIRLEKNPDYWKKGRPYLDAIDIKIIENRSTRILAFASGQFDMTFPTDVSVPLMKDVKSQAPDAICQLFPTGVAINLIVNPSRPPFDNASVRKAMALAIDRQEFNTILYEGSAKVGGAMLPAP